MCVVRWSVEVLKWESDIQEVYLLSVWYWCNVSISVWHVMCVVRWSVEVLKWESFIQEVYLLSVWYAVFGVGGSCKVAFSHLMRKLYSKKDSNYYLYLHLWRQREYLFVSLVAGDLVFDATVVLISSLQCGGFSRLQGTNNVGHKNKQQ